MFIILNINMEEQPESIIGLPLNDCLKMLCLQRMKRKSFCFILRAMQATMSRKNENAGCFFKWFT